jgi:hypothetical protein
MKGLILGNCQISGLAKCMRVMNPSLEIESIGMSSIEKDVDYVRDQLRRSDLVFLQTNAKNRFAELFSDESDRVLLYPRIYFAAYHPDIVYLQSAGRLVETSLGHYNSKLVLAGYLKGLTVRETTALFNRKVFQRIGYLDAWASALSVFLRDFRQTSLTLHDAPSKWLRRGCFMYSINHPKLLVLADLARTMLLARGLEVRTSNPEEYVQDDFKAGPIWPVYPEIAAAYGIEGDYCFKTPANDSDLRILDLSEFVEQSFAVYANLPRDTLTADRLDIRSFCEAVFSQAESKSIYKPASKANHNSSAASQSHPYASLKPYQYWRTAVASVPIYEVDPVGSVPFQINSEDKVASIGSCFARHVSSRLQSAGLNYYVTEAKTPEMNAEEAKRRSFGIYSARYGDVYTARQLIQLFDRAFGELQPTAKAWRRPDGRLVDPFRPMIEPDGYETEEEVENSRAQHLAAVRYLFETLDVLVFTLGLTEAWRLKRDGSLFPVAPGVVAGEWDPSAYEFINFGADEIANDLEQLIRKMASVNPHAKLILTVSPVPLVATYENRHVLVSTTYSKSALRVAADMVCRKNRNALYFPSYEIITSHFSKGDYFAANLRSVTPSGVDHVMRLFLQHICTRTPESVGMNSIDLSSGYDIVCDEERSIAS